MSEVQEPMIWSETLKIGVSSIDEQHQMLASMINTAQATLPENSARAQIEGVIHELMSYALYHFDTEEQLMLDYGYDGAEKERHFQEHRSFSAAIAEFQQDLRLGKMISRDELLGFVKDWLRSHMLSTDKKLGEFLKSIDKSSL